MAGFAKLFGSIVTSSVWCEDDATLRVWIAMLATCDTRGVVEGSVPGFANLARVTVEQMDCAIAVLSSPDPHSRTPDHEGRRIEVIPGGWRLLNYLSYRDRGQGKEGSRAPYMRERRKKGNALHPDVTRGTEERGEKTETDNGTPLPPLPPNGGAREVFAYWQSVMAHPTAKLTPGRERCIKARLKDGYTVDQLKQAIDGCKASDFHQGRPPASPDGKVFDDLTLICRSGEKVEMFLEILARPKPAPSTVLARVGARPSAFPTRTERNEQAAVEFIRDRKAREAAR